MFVCMMAVDHALSAVKQCCPGCSCSRNGLHKMFSFHVDNKKKEKKKVRV